MKKKRLLKALERLLEEGCVWTCTRCSTDFPCIYTDNSGQDNGLPPCNDDFNPTWERVE